MNIRTALSSNPRGLVVAFLAAGALAVTGCQGGGDPAADPTSASASKTASATPTPTPTPSAAYKPADASGKAQNVPVPVKPALADENSKEGLEAFTKYWFELLSYGYETGDLTEWSKLSSSECVACSNNKASIVEGYKLGRWRVGGRITTPSIMANMDSAAGPQVTVQTIQDASEFYLGDGRVGREPSPQTNSATVVLASYSNGAWTVSELHRLQ
ncbi:DUF6318 family protein [Pseudarthrobacter sp. J64]|uniref:DUF6318 family protein n=1 Tax=Pseudarthrobacter sp. J64 TaxID=3116485 RepID=UPI002E804FAE|nr:DUF6318 family protein [Pseudarthrobacter sp. J64]MEE2570704.1 DUF6318 family protein [Pseudarthrobacter sp. J64]